MTQLNSTTLDQLDDFLSQVEVRAFKMAVIATRNEDEALDIVQDSMMKLVQNYAQKAADDWPPLFYCILQSKINDWYRRQNVRKRWTETDYATDENHDVIEDAADVKQISALEQLNQTRAIEHLERALQQLPLRQQQAFMLRAWEGFDVAQTAQAMECSQGSVKTHYSRAIHALRNLLEDYQ